MKSGILCKEGCDPLLVLLGQHGACGVYEPSARLHEARGACKDAGLQRQQIIEPGSLCTPARIRISPPSAGTTARRVNQHAIKSALMALHPTILFAGQRFGLDIMQPCTPETLGTALQPVGEDVAG